MLQHVKNHLGSQKPSLTSGAKFPHPWTVRCLTKFLLVIALQQSGQYNTPIYMSLCNIIFIQGVPKNPNIFLGHLVYVPPSNRFQEFSTKSYALILMPFISGGIFTIGCSCANSITYGFEVHVGGESSRIPYKFLMNRRIDWQNLEGFIYDNSCNLHRYSLNRDPKKIEKFRFLVDGCHFQGQKS